ncbi:hypothetical protein UF64_06930 [Thalassospira sp. HJ]|uniref:tryptophan 7-halogenase n=1 Tax=Thalassospira sp. HJ TaxID=1616823 RepID=UPI0005CF8537|nr:tryptophan 7-halogenase [Thalassospira sp. HJ]KJE35840.1 hypothetical protein UF64_06930 [Thalassospira sp. HJ]
MRESAEYICRHQNNNDGPEGREILDIGVLGGGTSGLLTALALKKRRPYLNVSIIQSKKIPIIGVGESTVPMVVSFLHNYIGLGVGDLLKNVRPTIKQGVRYDWGKPGDYYFNAPFDWDVNDIGLIGSMRLTGSPNGATSQAILMEHHKLPLWLGPNGKVASQMDRYRFAYHLDNALLVTYLEQEALTAGIEMVDAVIVSADKHPQRDEIVALQTDDGRKLSYDLFVDCSGFRSTLLNKELEVPFIGFEKSLFSNRAIAFQRDHGGDIKPYTSAITMDAGWSWMVPTRHNDHCGYVHSSDFISVEEAKDEVVERFGEVEFLNTVSFRNGRHERCYVGNVIAIGNSYGFSEPLEASALLQIARQVILLVDELPRTKHDRSTEQLMNGQAADDWDKLKWFIAAHYQINNKKQTPFWDVMRSEADISGIKPLMDLFREGAPLSMRSPWALEAIRKVGIPYYGLAGFDTIMMGCAAPHRLLATGESDEIWRQRYRMASTFMMSALSHDEALAVFDEDPDLLMVAGDFNASENHRFTTLGQ